MKILKEMGKIILEVVLNSFKYLLLGIGYVLIWAWLEGKVWAEDNEEAAPFLYFLVMDIGVIGFVAIGIPLEKADYQLWYVGPISYCGYRILSFIFGLLYYQAKKRLASEVNNLPQPETQPENPAKLKSDPWEDFSVPEKKKEEERITNPWEQKVLEVER